MIPNFIKCLGHSLQNRLAPYLPESFVLQRPVFIIGCGRSGTSVLGRLLQKHPALVYLHEPRDIWLGDPRTDIWSSRARERNGRLQLQQTDVAPILKRTLRRRFATNAWRERGGWPLIPSRLVEKTPINGFRISYIKAIFPDARFVHIVRHGLEVAHSIAQVADQWNWFGEDSYKWELLKAEAKRRGYQEWIGACRSDVHRGALEWRLIVETINQQFEHLPPSSKVSVCYEGLLDAPIRTADSIQKNLSLEPSTAVNQFADEAIERKTFSTSDLEADALTQRIIGPLLARFGYE